MDEILSFWFQPIHPVRLKVFEKAFVFTFLLYMIERFRHVQEWLTSEGFHLTAATKSWHHFTPFPLLPDALVPVFGLILFGSILAVLLGWHRNLFIWGVLICAIYVQHADIISSFTLNKLYIVVFSILALSPRPRMFKNSAGETVELQSAWPVRTLQATILIQYFTAGTCKVLHGDWLKHTDTLWTHVQGTFCTNIGAWMLRVLPKWLWAVQMYLALIFEIASPYLFTIKKTRWIAIVWGLGFHLLIALTMHKLIYFSLQLVSFYILFLSDQHLIHIHQRFCHLFGRPSVDTSLQT